MNLGHAMGLWFTATHAYVAWLNQQSKQIEEKIFVVTNKMIVLCILPQGTDAPTQIRGLKKVSQNDKHSNTDTDRESVV